MSVGGAGGLETGGTVGGASGGAAIAGAGGAAGASGTTGTGGCPNACGPTQACVGSTCLLTDGQRCSFANQCASGVCTPFYQDVDGDGYGTGPAVTFCGTSAPVSYAAQSGDCCDNASNLAVAGLIHPNAGFQTTSAGGICGITWDYDCDGTVETSLSDGGCDPSYSYPNCQAQFINFPEDKCGMPGESFMCHAVDIDMACESYALPAETLGCK